MKLLKKHENTVFVHSLWRCGNSYFLGKFAGLENATVFAEPFNDQLSIVDKAVCATAPAADSGFSAYRGLVDPKPKVGGAGIQHYDVRFALNYWFAEKEHGQLRYLQHLIDEAEQTEGGFAVLGFVRSLGRVSMLRELRGFHLVLLRDPFDLYWSNWLKLRDEDTAYFALQYVMLAALCRDVPALDALALKYHLPKPKIKGGHYAFTDAYNQLHGRFSEDEDLLREAFILVFLLSYGAALTQADLVVSVDRLTQDAGYQTNIAGLIGDRTGHELDFSDCAATQYDEPAERAAFYEIYRAEQCTLEDSKHPRWVSGGRLIDSLLA
ncbi:hypothetical protein [Cerasicoccus maritimus]|uniref:hypothetical protein n=1 Tax=Cerasicoccus maritimus TaxID=490089 RepID=UPI002852A8D1|nr:hypothetical protein [Cerasicoccus maritimus]